MELMFEWVDEKAALNLKKHKVALKMPFMYSKTKTE